MTLQDWTLCLFSFAAGAGPGVGGLFPAGAAITPFAGRPVVCSGVRQRLFGFAVAAATFTVGRLMGVAVAA